MIMSGIALVTNYAQKVNCLSWGALDVSKDGGMKQDY